MVTNDSTVLNQSIKDCNLQGQKDETEYKCGTHLVAYDNRPGLGKGANASGPEPLADVVDDVTRIPARVYDPYPPQCSTWSKGVRCTDVSTHMLYCPDGKPCPAGWVCEHHARIIIAEFVDKLEPSEQWFAVPYTIDQWEDETLPTSVRKMYAREELERIEQLTKENIK